MPDDLPMTNPSPRCSVSQVLTLEDWDLIAYSYVRETDYSTIAFFVAWIIVGKYIFLTLFLAVTLEAFESKYDSETVEDVSAADPVAPRHPGGLAFPPTCFPTVERKKEIPIKGGAEDIIGPCGV